MHLKRPIRRLRKTILLKVPSTKRRFTMLSRIAKSLLVSLAMIISAICHAEDKKFHWPPGSAMYSQRSTSEVTFQYEDSIKATIKRIKELIKQECSWCSEEDNFKIIKSLKELQTTWEAHAEAECEWLYQLEPGPKNSWTSARLTSCKVGQTYTRLKVLRRAERCLKTKNRGRYSKDYISTCLYQLAPLSLY